MGYRVLIRMEAGKEGKCVDDDGCHLSHIKSKGNRGFILGVFCDTLYLCLKLGIPEEQLSLSRCL